MVRWLPIVIVFAGMLLAFAGCDTLEGDTLLTWKDEDANATFSVHTRVRGGTIVCDLHATRNGKLNRMMLAEEVEIHDLSLLRYNDWLLVLSGPYVLGGYDYASDKIAPAISDALPFTKHTQVGYVVANVKIGEGEDKPPARYREKVDR